MGVPYLVVAAGDGQGGAPDVVTVVARVALMIAPARRRRGGLDAAF